MTDLIGYLIKASAPGKRTREGVVLPPRPGSRNRSLRLAISADRTIPFDPAQWTIAILHNDEYSYGNLPLELLAARTALRIERHREPAPGQKPVALYKLRRDVADLYAIVDTKPLPDLSPARAAARTARRTCSRCADQRPRPLPEHTDGNRYCSKCAPQVAFERWCRQSRAMQGQITVWARAVLADPATVLIAGDRSWDIRHLRAETLAGTVIFDVRIRSIDDLDDVSWSGDTPEKAADRRTHYAGTVGRSQFAPIAAALTDARLIGWTENAAHTGDAVTEIPHVKPGDAVDDRVALFSGVAPQRHGDWFPEPKIPWMYIPTTYPPYTMHRTLLAGDSLTTELAHLRTLLNLMAHNTPPAPSWVNPTTRQLITAKDVDL